MVSLFWNCFSHKTEIHLTLCQGIWDCVHYKVICAGVLIDTFNLPSIDGLISKYSANTRWTLNQQIDQHPVDSRPTHRHQSAQDGTSAKINQLSTDCQSRVLIHIQLQMPFVHESEFVSCKL